MFFNLLTQAETSSNNPTSGGGSGPLVFFAIIAVTIIVMWIFSSRSNKKREEESKAMLNAIKPGNKVKTIGGVCGVVVEICSEDNTFVLETGTEKSGKSYIKFDMYAIHQTDAVVDKNAPKKEEKKEEKPVEEKVEEKADKE